MNSSDRLSSPRSTSLPALPPLWDHQKQAIEKALRKYALHFDAGTGKSRTLIEIYIRERKRAAAGENRGQAVDNYAGDPAPGDTLATKTIIFAPLNVCRNWGNQLKQYLGFQYEVYLCAGQTKNKKLKVLQDFRGAVVSCQHLFLLCNIESLRTAEYQELLATSRASFVVLDEAHNFKTYNSAQTRGLMYVLDRLKPRNLYLLTATPAPQGEIDLYTTFTLLGKNSDSFFLWRKKHFTDKNERRRGYPGYFPDYKISSESRLKFQQDLRDVSMTAEKDLVLDLPPLLKTNIYSEMSQAQRRHYETMHEFLFAIDAEGNELNAANFLSRTLRLQQILAGFLGTVPITPNPRLSALDDAIGKCTQGGRPEQFIIWTIFEPTYQQLSLQLDSHRISHGMLTGKESAAERFDAMNAFQAGDLRALIAHPRAGGVGIDLTAASFSIYYTKSFSLTDYIQSSARNYRGGSERHKVITEIHIITPDTIDEEISEALDTKMTVQDFLLGLKQKHGKEATVA